MPIDYEDREEILRQLINSSDRRTICELFRELYDNSEKVEEPQLRKSFQDLIIKGFVMGKKMNDRLVYYKDVWTDEVVVEDNKDAEEDGKRRSERWEPVISIIYPSRRVDGYFLASFNDILRQTMKNYEIIFLNNNPRREKFEWEDFRIKFIDVTKIKDNLFKIINIGLRMAKGKYILPLADDDIFFPEMLDILCAFAERTGADIVSSGWIDIDENNKVKECFLYKNKFDLKLYKEWNYLCSAGTLIRRKFLVDNKIEYNENMVSLADHALIYDCIKHGAKIEYLTTPLMGVRRHSGQMTYVRLDERRKQDYKELDKQFGEPDLFWKKRKKLFG